jgi:uncharacterized protein (DUF2132 family)
MTDKLKAYRDSLTQDQKDLLLLQAKAAKKAKAELRDSNAHLIKTEYMDSAHWATLASKLGVRMPHQNEATSVKIVRKYLKRTGVSTEKFNEHYTSMKYFVENNSRWSAYATAGIILELAEFG